jgi:hypothetical protein
LGVDSVSDEIVSAFQNFMPHIENYDFFQNNWSLVYSSTDKPQFEFFTYPVSALQSGQVSSD